MSNLDLQEVFRLLWPDFAALFRGDLAGITALIVIVLVLISARFLWFAMRERRRALRRIGQITAMLRGVTTDELVTRRPELRQRAEDADPSVRHLWREFDETLVESPDRTSLWNTLDAEHFFNSQSLAPRAMHNRLLNVVPLILTTPGVLRTFIGLITGLNGINLKTCSGRRY